MHFFFLDNMKSKTRLRSLNHPLLTSVSKKPDKEHYGMNKLMPIPIEPKPQFSALNGVQMNCGMPSKYKMEMGPLFNNMSIPFYPMVSKNQTLKDDQMQHQL